MPRGPTCTPSHREPRPRPTSDPARSDGTHPRASSLFTPTMFGISIDLFERAAIAGLFALSLSLCVPLLNPFLPSVAPSLPRSLPPYLPTSLQPSLPFNPGVYSFVVCYCACAMVY